MTGSLLGNRVLRTEDPRLLTGDADLPGRSAVRVAAARRVRPLRMRPTACCSASTPTRRASMPGVVAVWTAAELDVAPHHGFAKIHDDFARPPLATDRVRFVGDAVAVVFAETPRAGRRRRRHGAGRHRPAAVGHRRRARRSPTAHPCCSPTTAATSRSSSRPTHRSTSTPSPTSSCAAATSTSASPSRRWRPHGFAANVGDDGRLVVWASNQMPHYVRNQLAAALGIEHRHDPPDHPAGRRRLRRQGRASSTSTPSSPRRHDGSDDR